MISQLKQAILDLKTQVATVQMNDAQAFPYCAVFNNQVKEEEDGKTFNFTKPAVLIEIQNAMEGIELLGAYATINENMVFRFSIVMEQLDSSIGAVPPATGMDENLDIFDLRDALKTALTGFKPTNCSQLMYVSESQDYNHDNIYVYGISFKCSYIDTKGSPLDPDSTQWVTGSLTEINLNTFKAWISGNSYVENENVVIQNGKVYQIATQHLLLVNGN